MKKVFLTLIVFTVLTIPALASGYLPKYKNTVKHFGIGVYLAPKQIFIYKEPDEASKVVEVIQWNNVGIRPAINQEMKPNEAMITFLPEKNMAIFAVEEDIEGWYKIIYDQVNNRAGWVKNNKDSTFFIWKDFINKYGRSHGFYFWSDTPDSSKVLRSAPDMKLPPNNKFIYPKQIKLQMLRGNWMLLKIVDIDNISKVGWFKWRDNDGRFKLFLKLHQKF